MRFLWCSVLLPCLIPLQAQTQVGGGTCTNSTLSGTFFYLLAGSVLSSGSAYPYAELGKLVADGHGAVSGESHSSLAGSFATYSLTGTYSVQGDCSGTLNLIVNSQSTVPITFQIISGGLGAIVAFSEPSQIIVGRAYRQTAEAGQLRCGQASLSGAYGYLLTGSTALYGSSTYYSDAGRVASDGAGNLSTSSLVNLGGTATTISANGSYSVGSDCSGTAQLASQYGTSNYLFAVVEDGQAVLFIETDTGTTVSGTAQPQFVAPQGAVVNGASFAAQALSPGALFSIFGNALSQQVATAKAVPLPDNLGSTQVFVNGEAAPLLYVSANQINAQVPLDVPTSQPVSLRVTNGATQSNTVALNVRPAAPGIFVYDQNRAIVQNQDYSLNSGDNPAHIGDTAVAYLTGGGPVNAAGPVFTGGPAPAGISPSTLQYSIYVGGQPVTSYYLGLTPGFVGLYQANFKVPNLTAGDYPLVVTVNGLSSNGPLFTIAP